MILDLVFVVIVIFAIIKGFSRGLIVGIFSFIAFIIGLAAAIKLSAVVAGYIGKSVNLSDGWLPVISFAIVFIIVVLLVRIGAKLVQRTVEFAMLGWVNKLGGMILYLALYITVFSVFVFYAEQIRLVSQHTIDTSIAWPFIQPWGPKAINAIGVVIPFFSNMFGELGEFFAGVSDKVPDP